MNLPEFTKLVKEFHGDRSDPTVAKGLIDEIEKAFAACAVVDDGKLSLAAFMLKGHANYWW